MKAAAPHRVALMTHVGALSGAELALLRLVRNLDERRYVPVVVTFGDGPLVDRLRASGIEVVVEPMAEQLAGARRGQLVGRGSLRQAWLAAAFVPRLAKTLRRLNVDIIHAHSLKADVVGAVVAPLTGAALVWHVHDRISADYLPARAAAFMTVMSRRVPRHVVVNSQSTADTLLPLPRGWTLAYPGLERSAFTARPPAARHDPVVVGILGRIASTKGQDLFVRAAADIHRTHPQVRFRIIGTAMFGEQEFESSLRQLCTELGLDGVMEFTGFADRPDVALRNLDVFVHASPVPEPFGQVIVEAMAAMVPAVVTDAGGAGEIVRDEGRQLARLAAPGSVDQIAQGIRWILDNPAEAGAMSADALASVTRRFGVDRTAGAVMEAWDVVLAERGRFGTRRTPPSHGARRGTRS